MNNISKKDIFIVILCYVLWGFQSLYWLLGNGMDSFTVTACRILMTAIFTVAILAVQGRLPELKAVFGDKKLRRTLCFAAVFMLLDWTVFIVVVNAGHVLDTSLGYYISPLLIFAVGIVVYREKVEKTMFPALAVAVAGVVISTLTFGTFPLVPLLVASAWTAYSSVKKSVHIDGLLSIAAETLIISPVALLFLIFFRGGELAAFQLRDVFFILGSGIVTGLPMVLYSDSVRKFPLTAMCFIQYLSPTFALVCGLIRGERFTGSQLVSLLFFIASIAIFSIGQLRTARKQETAAVSET